MFNEKLPDDMHKFASAKKNYCLTKNHIIVLQGKKGEKKYTASEISQRLVLLCSWHCNWHVFGKKACALFLLDVSLPPVSKTSFQTLILT
jgi:hypothetical protein